MRIGDKVQLIKGCVFCRWWMRGVGPCSQTFYLYAKGTILDKATVYEKDWLVAFHLKNNKIGKCNFKESQLRLLRKQPYSATIQKAIDRAVEELS